MEKDLFLLVDAHAVIYRAYHALPDLTTPDGRLANAVFGFTRILLTAIRDLEPQYLAVTFDHPTPTFRHDQFAEYKGHREEMPDDLKPQVQMIKDVVERLNIPKFEMAGFEADDLIGTLSLQAKAKETPVMIVTGDKDIFQLVQPGIQVWLPSRGKVPAAEYDSQMVVNKMGVRPDQIVDLKALMGDASDNIPGIKGIGQKTAAKLLVQFDTLDKLYKAVEETQAGSTIYNDILKGAVLTKLIEGKESAYMSQQLATIDTNVDIELDLPLCKTSGYKKDEVMEMFEELGFKSLIGLLPADDFEIGLQDALF